MAAPSFGKLEKVDLRLAWASEAGDFTPWLAQAENIALLGDAIGIDLEVESQEKNVGPFRADILCKDTADGTWVLIENQLERTDHCHLGQLLTYAAGLDAVTVIWVAPRFTEEHRAALNWLNEITEARFRFFGLEVELWRIDGSAMAPKFNLVSSPNPWSRSARRVVPEGALSATQKLQLDYWTGLTELMTKLGGTVRPVTPQAQNWLTFSIGRTDFALYTTIYSRDKSVGVTLGLSGPNAKVYFRLLYGNHESYDAAIGEPLTWSEMPERAVSYVSVKRSGWDSNNRDDWGRQHRWLYDMLQLFHKAFSRAVKELRADDYVRDDEVGA